ncbi:MAG: hypothetical protein WCW17_03865 [Patescibacteria group bacterium]|jgi:hypothetical protein
MTSNTKNAIKHLVSPGGGEISNALANLLIDKEGKVLMSEIVDTFRGRHEQEPIDVAHAIVGITIFDPLRSGKWFLQVSVSNEAFEPRAISYGFVFGIINSVRWLCEKDLFRYPSDAGLVVHSCLVWQDLLYDGAMYYDRKEAQLWDKRLSEMLTATVELAKKNLALRKVLTDLLRRCQALKNSGGNIPPFTEWFLNDLHYKLFAALDLEARSGMLASAIDQLVQTEADEESEE